MNQFSVLIFLMIIFLSRQLAFPETKRDRLTLRNRYKPANISRAEIREPDGSTRGFYSYVDPNGILQHVEYTADKNGFRVRATNLPIHIAKISKNPEVEKAKIAHLAIVEAITNNTITSMFNQNLNKTQM